MAYAHSKLMAVPLPPVSGEMELLAKGPEMLSTRTRAAAVQVQSWKFFSFVISFCVLPRKYKLNPLF